MDASPDTAAPSRVRGLALAVLIVGSGSYGAGFWLTRDVGPPEDAFPTGARIIREHHRPGDLIVLLPFYATRARELLGDLQPVAPRDVLREDLRAASRVWLFALFGEADQRGPELTRAHLRRIETWDPAPGLRVELWENTAPWVVTYDFREHLRSARVVHEHSDGKREPCAAWTDGNGQGAPTGGRWSCPHDAEWFYVSPEWHRMGDQPRWCFWAHPPSDGRLLIQFPDVPLSGHLVGHGGHTLNSSVHAHARIDLDVSVGASPPQRFALELEEHWRPFMVSTATVGTATVTFAVSTPDAGANHFCFSASMRRGPERAP